MPRAIHESIAFNSRNRKVAIHCVFSVKDNTLMTLLFCERLKRNQLTVTFWFASMVIRLPSIAI